MKIKCEYCGFVFEILEDDLYEYVCCPSCENVFEADYDDVIED